jgi:hypothetical protein
VTGPRGRICGEGVTAGLRGRPEHLPRRHRRGAHAVGSRGGRPGAMGARTMALAGNPDSGLARRPGRRRAGRAPPVPLREARPTGGFGDGTMSGVAGRGRHWRWRPALRERGCTLSRRRTGRPVRPDPARRGEHAPTPPSARAAGRRLPGAAGAARFRTPHAAGGRRGRGGLRAGAGLARRGVARPRGRPRQRIVPHRVRRFRHPEPEALERQIRHRLHCGGGRARPAGSGSGGRAGGAVRRRLTRFELPERPRQELWVRPPIRSDRVVLHATHLLAGSVARGPHPIRFASGASRGTRTAIGGGTDTSAPAPSPLVRRPTGTRRRLLEQPPTRASVRDLNLYPLPRGRSSRDGPAVRKRRG